jgi:hypothetical protein
VARDIWSHNMSRSERRAYATLALIALASLAGIASADARGEEPRESHEYRQAAGQRQSVRREAESRQIRGTYRAPAQGVHATEHRGASYARERAAVSDHREIVARSIQERHPADFGVAHQPYLAGGGRVSAVSKSLTGVPVRVVRYGNTLSGTVERTIRPGLVSRTFVSGGQVQYTHVYQRQVWHQFGRSFAYETFVPAVRYPAVYYAWALAAWPRPVVYTWGWQVQPWYPMYGSLFTAYPVYTSPDLWMTDYIIAQSMQTAYQAQTAAPASEPPPLGATAAPVADSAVAAPAAEPSDAVPPPQPSSPAPQSSDTPSAAGAMPPAITPQVKAQLNAQIKVQLREQQAAAATPATLTTQTTPAALRPNHVFFQVVQPLSVPLATANGHCSLNANDYIKRTGGMSNDDWMIPVVVELSRPSDCPEGLQTRVGLNDLNAMENEQEAQVMEAMRAASKRMGPNGPPSGPGAQPTLIADGSAAPDPGVLDALRHSQ